jgi:hypothetical protein
MQLDLIKIDAEGKTRSIEYVLIGKSPRTGKPAYFLKPGQWVLDPLRALQFESKTAVIDYVRITPELDNNPESYRAIKLDTAVFAYLTNWWTL